MARIADDEVQRLKAEVSIERLAEARGIKLARHGADLIGLCPFHDDQQPSLVISPKKNLWHCLGACQTGGSVIDWVMRADGVSFRLALEMLRRDHGVPPPPPGADHQAMGPKLEAIAEVDEPDQVVLRRVLEHYYRTLKESPEALAYLKARGLDHPEVIDHFQLGFANRTLGYRLPSGKVQSGMAIRAQLERLGVMRQSGHEHLNGSLVVPILGERGEVLGMYGRKITEHLRAGTPLHLYLPGPHRGVFNIAGLEGSREVILCEALIDALTFWCAGFRHVTAAYGVEGFTDDHRQALRRLGTERVLIAYDRDEAGDKAAEKLAPELADMGIEVLRVVFPHRMDANEYALKVTPAVKSLETVLRAAKWMAGKPRVQVPGAPSSAAPAPASAPPTPAPPPPAGPPAAVLLPLAASPAPAPAPAPAASPPPPPAPSPPPVADPAVTSSGDEVLLAWGNRQWRVRGLDKNTSLASIKVSLRVMVGPVFFQDTLELMSARARAAFLKQAADELAQGGRAVIDEAVLKTDLGRVTLKLEELLEERLRGQLEPQKKTYQMSEAERDAALELLRDPHLLDRIVADFERCGVVGEETNKLFGYLAATSRKLETPLAVVIQSSSAAGKSSLMDAVLRFVPEEEQVSYSAMTGQSLFYMGALDLQHKVLAIAEEQGAQKAVYALKILQSSGELTIASTGKDPTTGRLVTHEYRVQGPVMVMLTTTSIEVDEELLNRCVVLTVDEGREQTRAIQRLQREARTLDGLMRRRECEHLVKLHQNAQRLLLPVQVVNPFARELRFADHTTRTRRDHAKYLSLIDAIALCHQHQRKVKTTEVAGAELRYIEVVPADLATADRLAEKILSRSLDELAPPTRRLLGLIDQLVTERAAREHVGKPEVRFSRRELRDYSGFGQTQLKVHLGRLEEMEYVLVVAGGARRRLLYALDASAAAAAAGGTTNLGGPLAGSGRPLVGGPDRPDLPSDSEEQAPLVGQTATSRIRTDEKSHRTGTSRPPSDPSEPSGS